MNITDSAERSSEGHPKDDESYWLDVLIVSVIPRKPRAHPLNLGMLPK
jgi:hypothetical protein